MLKDLEEEAGRTPEGKHQGIVPLDIDVLQWNEQILKPADMKRDYVREALRSLLPET
jgi:2-amino-4-hydroxy-6-hydroxymethyldihydropteridine diphosphokinase